MKITVVGAGVSGLTCGVVLAERGHDVTIIADEVPGHTSTVAAAVWDPYDIEPEADPLWGRPSGRPDWSGLKPAPTGGRAVAWALTSYDRFVELAGDKTSGVSMIEFRIFGAGEAPSWAAACGYCPLEGGYAITVPLIETPEYLPYLVRRFRGTIETRKLRSLQELSGLVVNCAGIGARELVPDADVIPHRGQVVIADRVDLPYGIVHEDDLMYVIPRRHDCILGGTNDVSDSLEPDPATTARILEKCRPIVGDVRVREVKVGLRPFRNRVRLEREGNVIHNYGHGGSGFTVSWGCAEVVATLCES